jgi:WXG100 family type VII secretion target
MNDEIRAAYDELTHVTSQFSNQAQTIQQMLQNIRGSYDPLKDGGWKGLSSRAFFAEMEATVFPATQRLHEALDAASEVTKSIIQTLQDAEEEAAGLFRNWRPE